MYIHFIVFVEKMSLALSTEQDLREIFGDPCVNTRKVIISCYKFKASNSINNTIKDIEN